jgi:VWFA-related protein
MNPAPGYALRRGVRVGLLAVLCLIIAKADAQRIPFGERIDVEVIELEVFITDRAGLPVTDLRVDEVSAFINGELATIVDFVPHSVPESQSAPKQSHSDESIAHEVLTSDPALPRVWLVFVDMLRTGEARRMGSIRTVRDFLNGSMVSGDLAMIAYFDGSALRIALPLTSRRAEVTATMSKLARRAAPSRLDLLGFQLDEEDRVRLEMSAMRALRDFITIASGIRGQSNLMVIGGGYRLHGWDDMRLASKLQTEYEHVRDALATSGVILHSIWASNSELAVGADMPASREPAIDGPPPATAPIEMGSTIAALAYDSGGVSTVSSPDLHGRLRAIEARRDSYYSLALRVHNSAPGRRLDIKVRVARDGVRVHHRRLMRAATELDTNRQVNLGALLIDRPSNPWKVRAKVGPVRRDALRRLRAPVEIHIPANALLFVRRLDRHSARLQFYFSVRDASGNYTSVDPKELILDLSDAELAILEKRGIRYSLDLLVSSGRSEVAATVVDTNAQTQSTVRFEIAPGRRPMS